MMDQRAYNDQYQKEHIKQIKFKLNRKTDDELICWLESKENIQGYLKELVKTDMEKASK